MPTKQLKIGLGLSFCTVGAVLNELIMYKQLFSGDRNWNWVIPQLGRRLYSHSDSLPKKCYVQYPTGHTLSTLSHRPAGLRLVSGPACRTDHDLDQLYPKLPI